MTATTTAASVQGGSQWVQTGPLTFNHALTTTAERISEVPELTIPFPGVWELTYHVRTSFTSGNQKALWIHTWLGKDGVRIEGSETTHGRQGPDSESVQDTVGQTVLVTFQTGENVTLHGRYSGEGNASVLSNDGGRTSVVAHWVSPGF
ncbi:hypothetical protein FNV62_07175 [Streptomyces sp. RLB3-17]|uniref:hypothetical protein n=1 Tax=unclassified Streptomyces TaxID=2593676 RepID=UPI0011647559|nr:MULTISPECIES: hypothetical protein [unclassified Streptomyces]NMI55962.1 hypothetical protein [Streptomyces sp. RLA2-12]QDN55421.1 hypothetical protein FNV67_08945 [Streptomyces sp. S1D4-20]QDN65599.1 hypothetical protein FNV66_08540 [Streptomyces sp. S1D4-14]QDN96242.1 hypothetical protein FNV58_09680 [Streptomyces sp. RLB1-9]QDO17951.1 hypothetical protein FNV65_08130 [Streptomyces sp. S1A1-8]